MPLEYRQKDKTNNFSVQGKASALLTIKHTTILETTRISIILNPYTEINHYKPQASTRRNRPNNSIGRDSLKG